MAQLTGQKVKDTYSKLLQLSTSGVTTTRKTIESGIGEATALSLGSSSVGLQNPYVSSVPVGTTEFAAMFADSNGQLVTRQLGTNAFESGYPAPVVDFDSGWKDINQYDSVSQTGIVKISGLPSDRTAQYRVINRTVHLRGNIYIPLSQNNGDPGAPAVTTISDIEQTQSSTVSEFDNGVTVGNGVITLPSIKPNDVIKPEKDTYLSIFFPFFRNGKTFNAGDQFKFMYNTFGALKITDNGNIVIESLHAFEMAGPSALQIVPMNPIREIMNRWETGSTHYISSYVNYKTYNINNSDQRVIATTGLPVPYNFSGDGSDMYTWGGLCIVLDGLSFNIADSVPLDSIH